MTRICVESVAPGDRVRSGQELGRLESSEAAAELERLQRELELRLVERLRHPAAAAADPAFGALRELLGRRAARDVLEGLGELLRLELAQSPA